MGLGGASLKVVSMALRVLQFIAALVILAIFGYFLVYLRDNNIPTYTWVRAVEGLAGAGALYALIAFFLVCCLGGAALFAFLGIALDLAFVACFIAVAVLTAGGNTNCSALGNGDSGLYNDYNGSVDVSGDTARHICELYKVTFALAIIEVILFLISALFDFFMGRHHQRVKRNEATAAPVGGRRFWRRGGKNRQREMEQGAVGTN